jgi:hypothetical protein
LQATLQGLKQIVAAALWFEFAASGVFWPAWFSSALWLA